jgi:hypothetical protein
MATKANPFFYGLPLTSDPYFSRSFDNLDTADFKNYYITGFKPGYPLQASELNEIQEQFYLQQTLNNTCMNLWWGTGGNTGPFWEGATPIIPLNSSDIAAIAGSSTLKNITVPSSSDRPGWFFLNLPLNSSVRTRNPDTHPLVGVWFYTPNSLTFTNVNLTISATYGLFIKSEKVTYSEDPTLSDNAGGGSSTGFGFINEGADRFKLSLTNYGISTLSVDSSNIFYPLFTVSSDATNYYLKMVNGYQFGAISK